MRLASLSGIANRYIDLRLGSAAAPKIPSGGVIGPQDTTSAVDIDQLFNTLNPPTRKGIQNLIQGSASQFAGKGAKAQVAWQYLNPAIASSSMLFSEIDRNAAASSRSSSTRTAGLVSDVAKRQADLSGLIQNLVDHDRGAGRRRSLARPVDSAAARLHAARRHDLRRTCATRSTT